MGGDIAMMEEQKMMCDINTLYLKDAMHICIKSSKDLGIKQASKSLCFEDCETMKESMDNCKADQEELNDFFKDYANENDKINYKSKRR